MHSSAMMLGNETPAASTRTLYFAGLWSRIAGIGWVSEIVEAAGGVDVFADRAQEKSAKARIFSAGEVIAAARDIIIGSWCGKRFRPEGVRGRAGFEQIPAVRHGAPKEVKSTIILQPGPAALTDGLDAIAEIYVLQGIVRHRLAYR
jgi:iron complex transport system substrate-binding protein